MDEDQLQKNLSTSRKIKGGKQAVDLEPSAMRYKFHTNTSWNPSSRLELPAFSVFPLLDANAKNQGNAYLEVKEGALWLIPLFRSIHWYLFGYLVYNGFTGLCLFSPLSQGTFVDDFNSSPETLRTVALPPLHSAACSYGCTQITVDGTTVRYLVVKICSPITPVCL